MRQPQNMTRNKAIFIDWEQNQAFSNEYVLKWLTMQQYTALIAVCDYFKWRTRWANPPTAPVLTQWTDELIWRLMQDVNLCALMIACITDNPDTRDALNQWFLDQLGDNESNVYQTLNQWIYEQSQGSSPGQKPGPGVTGGNLIPNLVDCNLPSLWGAEIIFLRWLDKNNIDFLENIEVLTNPIENLSEVLTAFAGVDPTIFGSALLKWVSFIQDSLKENYDAQWTTAYENEVACGLFCLAQENGCELSLEDVFLYFFERLGAINLPETLLDGVVFWTTGIWTGTNFCDVMMTMQLAAFYYGNKFLDLLGVGQIAAAMQLGLDQPNDDYLVLCEDCNTVTISLYAGYNNFEFVTDMEIQVGEPFEIDVSPGTGFSYEEVWIDYGINFVQTYEFISGTIGNTTGEYSWALRDGANPIVNGAAGTSADDCRQDAVTNIGFFNNESHGSFTVRITLNLVP